MKIFIGITTRPVELEQVAAEKCGKLESLTEIGPFLTREEAEQWLGYLKKQIGDIEEIVFSQEPGEENLVRIYL